MAIVPVMPVVTVVTAVLTVAAFMANGLLAVRLRRRGWREAILSEIGAVIIAELIGTIAHLAGSARTLAIAVHALALRIELLAIGHDDAAVVLGMLQIVLRKHRIARRLGVARQSHVFLGDVGRSAPNFHVRAIGFEAARKRIVVAAALAVVVVPATSAAILLSLPHCPNGSRLT